MNPKGFFLDKKYACSITYRIGWKQPLFTDTYITKDVDHPAWAELRDKLESEGFIKTERMWCNGDRVIKPFLFNDRLMQVGDKWPSGAAAWILYKDWSDD